MLAGLGLLGFIARRRKILKQSLMPCHRGADAAPFGLIVSNA
nr:hypothetical protein [Nitrosospira sp. Nsp14]